MFDSFIRMVGVVFGQFLDFAQEVLTGQAHAIDGIWNAVSNIGGGIILTIATQILVICMLLELVQVAQRFDTVTFEMGTKIMTKFVLAKMAIEQGPNLLRGIFETTNTILEKVSMTQLTNSHITFNITGHNVTSIPVRVTEAAAMWQNVIDAYDNLNFLEKIPAQMVLFIAGIALLVCGGTIIIAAFARMFEILVYCFVSPIPIAFLPIGHGDGSGFSPITMGFFKSFAAVCLQGVIMMGCIQIFMTMSITSSIGMGSEGGYWSSVLSLLIVAIVLVTAVKKSGDWARQVLGVAH